MSQRRMDYAMNSFAIFFVLFGVVLSDKSPLDTCHVTTENIDCSNREIPQIPQAIYLHHDVKSLNLRHNNITEINTWNFFSANGVLFLDLSFNHITFVASQSFIGIENLNRLVLSNNRLASIPIQFLAGLKQLVYLDLSHNYLRVLLRDMFESTTKLQELKLSSNPLQTIDPDAFRHLTNLERLFLDNTYLTTVNDNLFDTNYRINTLDLSHNLFKDFPNIYLPELRNLDFSYNHLCFLDINTFPSFPQLTSLYLNHQHGLKAIFQYAFNNTPNLRVLQCSNNKELKVIDPQAFKTQLTGKVLNLEQLHMRNNNLKRINSSLLNWPTLLYLDFRGNPWRCDCNIRWMHNLNVRQHFQEHLICQHPKRLKNRLLSDLSPNDMVCDLHMLNMSIFVFSIGFIIAVTGLLGYLFYKMVTKPKMKYTKIIARKNNIEMEKDRKSEA